MRPRSWRVSAGTCGSSGGRTRTCGLEHCRVVSYSGSHLIAPSCADRPPGGAVTPRKLVGTRNEDRLMFAPPRPCRLRGPALLLALIAAPLHLHAQSPAE